jgi:hypothetical protein
MLLLTLLAFFSVAVREQAQIFDEICYGIFNRLVW